MECTLASSSKFISRIWTKTDPKHTHDPPQTSNKKQTTKNKHNKNLQLHLLLIFISLLHLPRLSPRPQEAQLTPVSEQIDVAIARSAKASSSLPPTAQPLKPSNRIPVPGAEHGDEQLNLPSLGERERGVVVSAVRRCQSLFWHRCRRTKHGRCGGQIDGARSLYLVWEPPDRDKAAFLCGGVWSWLPNMHRYASMGTYR